MHSTFMHTKKSDNKKTAMNSPRFQNISIVMMDDDDYILFLSFFVCLFLSLFVKIVLFVQSFDNDNYIDCITIFKERIFIPHLLMKWSVVVLFFIHFIDANLDCFCHDLSFSSPFSHSFLLFLFKLFPSRLYPCTSCESFNSQFTKEAKYDWTHEKWNLTQYKWALKVENIRQINLLPFHWIERWFSTCRDKKKLLKTVSVNINKRTNGNCVEEQGKKNLVSIFPGQTFI